MALHFEDVGLGTPVLLLHGFPFTGLSFWPQLAAPPPGVRLLVPDLRGFGRSKGAGTVTTMEQMAEDAQGVLDAAGVKEAFVGGVSMGGYVAIALTRLAPARVRGLMFFDSQAGVDDEAGKARREATAVELEAKGMGPLVEAMLPKLLSKHASPEVKSRLEAMMRAIDPKAAAAASRGMALRTHGKDILPRFAGPSLVLVGEDDVITPVDRAKELAALLPNSRLVIVPQAGHLANLEQPAVIAAEFARLA